MNISVETIHEFDGLNDPYYFYENHTVYVGDHRILTIATYDEFTAGKWLKQALKANNSSSLPNSLIVGFSLERQSDSYSTDELIYIYIGSHCLIFHLDEPGSYRFRPPKFLIPFFSDPKVVVVGKGMKEKADRFENVFGVKIKNAVDLNELAVKVMKMDEYDLGRYDLDRLAKAVLGKHVYVERPYKKIEWFQRGRYHADDLTTDMVLFTTVDAFLCFRIACKLLDMIPANAVAAVVPSLSNKKKKKKNKKKIKKKN